MMTSTFPQSRSDNSIKNGLKEIQSKKEALMLLEQALKERINELKQLCLKEGELTGQLPVDYPLQPREPIPQIRRRPTQNTKNLNLETHGIEPPCPPTRPSRQTYHPQQHVPSRPTSTNSTSSSLSTASSNTRSVQNNNNQRHLLPIFDNVLVINPLSSLSSSSSSSSSSQNNHSHFLPPFPPPPVQSVHNYHHRNISSLSNGHPPKYNPISATNQMNLMSVRQGPREHDSPLHRPVLLSAQPKPLDRQNYTHKSADDLMYREVVQKAKLDGVEKFQPYYEETKPFQLSDFYKYSSKHRQKPVVEGVPNTCKTTRQLQEDVARTNLLKFAACDEQIQASMRLIEKSGQKLVEATAKAIAGNPGLAEKLNNIQLTSSDR